MAEWSVTVEARAPVEQSGRPDAYDFRISDFVDGLVPWNGAAGASNESWSARISVDAEDIGEAIVRARETIEGVARQCRLPMWPTERIEAVEGNRYEAEFFPPDLISHPWGCLGRAE